MHGSPSASRTFSCVPIEPAGVSPARLAPRATSYACVPVVQTRGFFLSFGFVSLSSFFRKIHVAPSLALSTRYTPGRFCRRVSPAASVASRACSNRSRASLVARSAASTHMTRKKGGYIFFIASPLCCKSHARAHVCRSHKEMPYISPARHN